MHYAVKVEKHTTMLSAARIRQIVPPMVQVEDTYIPQEAFALLLLTFSDSFPKLDSVYLHDRYQTTVMSACFDYSPDREPGSIFRRFPSFSGRYLMTQDNKPLLTEMEACKVAGQLLQAIVQLADMRLWHGDLSVNNFILDEKLNVSEPPY
jgi:hypothetical protein